MKKPTKEDYQRVLGTDLWHGYNNNEHEKEILAYVLRASKFPRISGPKRWFRWADTRQEGGFWMGVHAQWDEDEYNEEAIHILSELFDLKTEATEEDIRTLL